MMCKSRLFRFFFLLLLLTGLLACNPTSRPTVATEVSRAWPAPPAAPRYVFVTEFSTPEDLGIQPSFWSRLVGLVAGASEQRMVRPMAVVADDEGQLIFVADPGVQGVHRFDLRRSKYRLLRIDDNMPAPSPVGMAISSTGQVFITDSQLGRLLTVKPGSDHLEFLGTGKDLLQPTGIVFDDNTGKIFVVDTADHNIKEFALSGVLVNQFSRRGNAPGELNYPTYLWQDMQHRLLVSDSLNFRIQFFDADGQLRDGFGKVGDGSGSLSRPKGVASDSFGHIYIIDSMFHALQVFDETGTLLLSLGEQGQGAGEFWLPNGLFVDVNNLIYIADSHNQRVQILQYVGVTP